MYIYDALNPSVVQRAIAFELTAAMIQASKEEKFRQKKTGKGDES